MKSIHIIAGRMSHVALMVIITVSMVVPSQIAHAQGINLFGFFDRVVRDAGDLKLVDNDLQERAECAAKINAYYSQWNLPLSGYGHVFVYYADKYDLDCTLVAAIAMRESTGGKFTFENNNPFGWGKRDFKSFEHAIAYVSKSLGGHHGPTAHYYKDKDVIGILQTYNPPSVVADYAHEVIRIMERIDGMEIEGEIYILS